MDLIEEKIIRLIQHEQDHHRSQIVLDGIYLEKISLKFKEQMEDYEDIFKISLKSCQLKSLNNLPQMPFLNSLNLANNQFSPRELKKITIYKNLQSLDLSQNKIKTLKQIENLKELKHLIFLNLEGNPVQKIKNYRDKIFNLFPSLQLLDLKDKFNSYLLPSSTEADEIYSNKNLNSVYSNSINTYSESDQESDIYVPENSESSEEEDQSEDQQSQQTEKSVINIFDQLIQK